MIKEIMQLHLDGKIDRKEYGLEMFGQYEKLFEYNELLSESDIQYIEITKDAVIVGINSMGLESECVKMRLFPKDAGSIPSVCLSFGQYEKTELSMVKRLIHYIEQDAVVFDIGANLGWYTLNFRRMNNNLKCYSFEPVGNIYNQLIENLKYNEMSADRAFNIGFHNVNKKLQFYYNKSESGSSSMVNLRETDQSVLIECIVERLDEFVERNEIDSVDFIKCDVEGAELFVFEGALNTIKNYKPIIFTEMLRKWSAKFEYHPNDIIELLSSMGYCCYIIKDEEKLTPLYEVDEKTSATNYFFLHTEAHRHIISDLICD